MSIKLIVQIMEEAELPRPWGAVLLAMADHADDDGNRCFPSVDRIAWKANYKPRQVSNIIRDMTAAGILTKVREASRHHPIEYKINVENTPRKLPFDQWKSSNGRHAISQQEEPRDAISQHLEVQSHELGVQSRNLGVQSIASEPLIEPSNKPSEGNRHSLAHSRFEQFWKSYPRKIGKKEAESVFRKIPWSQVDFDGVMEALEMHKLSDQWQKDGGQFIPHPTTWLRKERWEDEVKPASTQSSGNGKYLDPYALFEQAQREKAEYEAARTHGDTGSVDNGVQDRTATRNSLPFRID